MRFLFLLIPLLLSACSLLEERVDTFQGNFLSGQPSPSGPVFFLFPEAWSPPEGTYDLAVRTEGNFEGAFLVLLRKKPENCLPDFFAGVYGHVCPEARLDQVDLAPFYLDGTPKKQDLTPHLSRLREGFSVGLFWDPLAFPWKGGELRIYLKANLTRF